MKISLTGCVNGLLFVLSLSIGNPCFAQSSETPPPPPPPPPPIIENLTGGEQPWEEYSKQIQSRNTIAALGADVFGDEVNLSNGALSFSVTDINLAGNSSLPVAVTRTLGVASRSSDSKNDNAFGDWDLDIPRLEGVYGTRWQAPGGVQGVGLGTRCSVTTPPHSIVVQGGNFYGADDYWNGVQAHMPGGGELLVANQSTPRPTPAPLPTGGYKWLTPGLTYFSCLGSIQNPTSGAYPYAGEGFLAVTTDGTKYWFDWMAQYYEAPLAAPATTNATGALARRRNVLYVTKVEDRFGNTVNYSYSNTAIEPVKLDTITSNDGRKLMFSRNPQGQISAIQEMSGSIVLRTWDYTYDYTSGSTRGSLTQVELPDDSKWIIDLKMLSGAEIAFPTEPESRNCSFNPSGGGDIQVFGGPLATSITGTVRHPAGAVGTFKLEVKKHGRSKVPQICNNVESAPLGQTYSNDTPVYIKDYAALTLMRKLVTGPGLPLEAAVNAMVWDYSYISGASWVNAPWNPLTNPIPPTCDYVNNPSCGDPVCFSDSCSGTAKTTILGPAFADNTGYNKREWTRFSFGNTYRYDEGKLKKTERGSVPLVGGGGENILQTDQTGYELPTNASPPRYGTSLRLRGDGFTAEVASPQSTTITLRDNTCFRWDGYGYDAYYRPTSVVRSRRTPNPDCSLSMSTLVSTKSESMVYSDYTTGWVIGQVKQVNDTTNPASPIIAERTTFDSVTQLPTHRYSFEKLQQFVIYHPITLGSTQAGLPWQVYDGSYEETIVSDRKKTTLSNYKRGTPQNIHYHDNSSESVTVNDRGEISTHTNPVNSITSYGHDEMGRINSIAYQNESSSCQSGLGICWHHTNISFTPIPSNQGSSSFGLPVGSTGSWKRTVYTGNGTDKYARSVTYYDGLWRPVLTDEHEYIGGDPLGATSAGTFVDSTRRMVNNRYDHAGRSIALSYPNLSLSSYNEIVNGTERTYDALGRITKKWIDSELIPRVGPLTVKYLYEYGFKTRIIDENSRETVISYQAFDEPTTDYPVLIQAPHNFIQPPDGINTSIVRDVFGKPKAISRTGTWGTTPLSTTRSYVYDSNQRLCKTVEPESGATIVTYDSSDNVRWSAQSAALTNTNLCQDANVIDELKTTFSYDQRNRPIAKSYGDSTTAGTTRTWTLHGLPQTIASAGSLWAYTYNKRGLPTGETLSYGGQNFAMGYSYDDFGARRQMSYPDGSVVDYAPNRLGQASKVGTYALPATGASIAYHPNGAVNSFKYGNQLTHTATLNTRLLPLTTTISGSVLADTYTWDATGNLKGIADGGTGAGQSRSRTMAYDNADRLISTNFTALGNFSYQYDKLDNLRVVNKPGQNTTYDYDDAATGRLKSIHTTGNSSAILLDYAYDSQGNASRRGLQGFRYDRSNRMVDVHQANNPAEIKAQYRYDGNRRRIGIAESAGERIQVYSSKGQLVYETTPPTLAVGCPPRANRIKCSGFEPGTGSASSATTTRYIYLGTMLIAKTTTGNSGAITRYIHTDHLGSVIADSSTAPAQVTFREQYEPYGAPAMGPYLSGPGFTGHVTDTLTQLSYMQTRYYDPLAGRFLSTDPIGAGNGDNFNRYWYANNNPYRFTDPDGRFSRGRDLSNTKWRKINNAQQSAAISLDRGAAKITDALNTGKGIKGVTKAFEKRFGKGSATPAKMAQVASDMSAMAGDLRNTGAGAIPVIGMSKKEMTKKYGNMNPTVLLAIPPSGKEIIANLDHPDFGDASTLSWAIGHEAAHTALGYIDEGINGVGAFKFGGPAQRKVFGQLPSTQRLVNPDHLMDQAQ